jgi:transporter family-2 protein
MNSIYVILATAAGMALATQVAINSQVRALLGSPMQATMVSLIVSSFAAISYMLYQQERLPNLTLLSASPWWMWTGGLMGVFYLWATVVSAPKLGVAVTLGLVIAGQVVTSLIIDHFGLLNVPHNSASLQRIAGVLLIVTGVVVLGLKSH